jgi:hypothetical protein
MADQDPKTPEEGPIPDPHADEPVPRPDSHTVDTPGADTPRPDQYEDLGPVPELFGAAGLEAATRVSDDPGLQEEAIRRGAEVEGVETAQIFGLILATAAVLVTIVVASVIMMTRVGAVEEERRLGDMAYPELTDLRHAAQQRLSAYERDQEAFRIPLERAQALMAEEARQQGPWGDVRLPDSRRGFNLAYPRSATPGLVAMPAPEAREEIADEAEPPGEPAEEEVDQDDEPDDVAPDPPGT